MPDFLGHMVLFEQVAAGQCDRRKVENVLRCDGNHHRARLWLPDAANQQGMVTI
jgi:hypothetical protein